MGLFRNTPSHRDVSGQQAPATGGSACCQATIVDRQTLLTGRVYRACVNCGAEV
jgi:hypothetical protein